MDKFLSFIIIIFISTLSFGQSSVTYDLEDFFTYSVDCETSIISLFRNDVELPCAISDVSIENCPGIVCVDDEIEECCIELLDNCRNRCCDTNIPQEEDDEPQLEEIHDDSCCSSCDEEYNQCVDLLSQDRLLTKIYLLYEERSRHAIQPYQFDNRSGSIANGVEYADGLQPSSLAISLPIRKVSSARMTACEGYSNYPENPYLSPCSSVLIVLSIVYPVLNDDCQIIGVNTCRFKLDELNCAL